MAVPDEIIGARVRTPKVRALPRRRVDDLLDRLWDHRITLVVAPAGSGKTTALAQLAERSPDPVAWYRADSADGSVAAFLGHVERALTTALPGLEGGWETVGAAAAALERWPGPKAALLIDDLHSVRGTPAEALLERLVDYLPPHVVVAAASRSAPSFDLTRLRLTGELLEVGADDLRFRTWETEQLFRELYGSMLPPEDLARLTRRVEGWAAGLQLFHLAARAKPPAEQRRLIDVVSSRSRLAREYLTRNVLDGLSEDLRTFLVDTCVLGVVTPGLADRLRGRDDSAQHLADLEAMQLFTIPLDDDGTYRYHEVLRSHLEVLLAERDGDDQLRERYCRAGELLAAEGLVAEALRCYGRCGNWDALSQLLGRDEEGRLSEAHRWIDSMPVGIVEHDPWLLLAKARTATAAGRLRDAIEGYQQAERLFGDAAPAERCQRERLDLQSWLSPLAPPPSGWMGLLRAGLRRDPVGVAERLAAEHDSVALVLAGILCLVAGHLSRATELLERSLVHPDAGPRTIETAKLGLAVAGLFSPEGTPVGLVDDVEATADTLGYGFLARLARACLALTDREGMEAEAARVVAMCDADGDAWGAAVGRVIEGFAGVAHGRAPADTLVDGAARCRAIDSPVLEAVALGALALVRVRRGDPDALPTATAAEHLARTVGAVGARIAALTALAELDPATGREHLTLAAELAAEAGLAGWPVDTGRSPRPASTASPEPAAAPLASALTLRCFGTFGVRVQGVDVDLSPLRPRARAALRLLALHGGRPVHREVLVDALWPDSDPEAGLRNLQVAVSSIRQVLAATGGEQGGSLLVRAGDTYRLVVDSDASDVAAFDSAVRTARAASTAGDHDRAALAAERALTLHGGDLLVEDGPADWVVSERERCRVDAASAAALLAEVELGRGRPAAAATACERGLRIDRYHDQLWRLLVEACGAAGDRAAAARARAGYEDVMRELGVTH